MAKNSQLAAPARAAKSNALTARVAELRAQAEEVRLGGDVEQADRIDAHADRLELAATKAAAGTD